MGHLFHVIKYYDVVVEAEMDVREAPVVVGSAGEGQLLPLHVSYRIIGKISHPSAWKKMHNSEFSFNRLIR